MSAAKGEVRMTRRDVQKQQTRELLLKTATELFETEGFEETTIRKVAQKAGVAVGTVFVHFPDKSSLFAATLLERLEALVHGAFRGVPEGQGVTLRDQMLHLVGVLLDEHAAHPVVSQLLVRESIGLTGEIGEAIGKQMTRVRQGIDELVIRAKVRDELDMDVDIDGLTSAIMGLMLLMLVRTGGQKSLDRDVVFGHLQTQVDVLFHGLGQPAPVPEATVPPAAPAPSRAAPARVEEAPAEAEEEDEEVMLVDEDGNPVDPEELDDEDVEYEYEYVEVDEDEDDPDAEYEYIEVDEDEEEEQ